MAARKKTDDAICKQKNITQTDIWEKSNKKTKD